MSTKRSNSTKSLLLEYILQNKKLTN